MKTDMSRNSQGSTSKRHFHWTNKVGSEEDLDDVVVIPSSIPTTFMKSSSKTHNPSTTTTTTTDQDSTVANVVSPPQKKKFQTVAVSRLRSIVTAFNRNRLHSQHGLGPRVVGTLFGHKRGHVHFAFQKDPGSEPAFLIELATPISGLVREMASGLVRIALECDKPNDKQGKKSDKQPMRLLDEPVWRTYCNGKRCGFATKKELSIKEQKVLSAVEPISMGAGVLPVEDGLEPGCDGEIMYMRAKFERIVGSRDCEAFYMMNPDNNGAPELSIYLLRI